MSILTSQILSGLEEVTIRESKHSLVTLADFNGTSVIIKTCKNPKDGGEFEEEATILKLLDGAGGAPKMLGYFDSPLRMVISLAGTETLNAYVAESRQGDVLLRVALKTAKKLKEIHDCKVVHNDIKMDNIMVQATEGSACPEINIIDYGLACFIGVSLELDVGPKFYHIAPEVRRGDASTPASDVYSLGIVFSDIAERAADKEVRILLIGISRKMTRENREERKSLRTIIEFLRHSLMKLRDTKTKIPQEAPVQDEVNEVEVEGCGALKSMSEGTEANKLVKLQV